eukprot:snap_masked-scaffold_1-processed-gene-21.20-mRNA-1 protein AED:0.02 eAED:0.03 QI:0/-1/0/1/-1/1/1/0/325
MLHYRCVKMSFGYGFNIPTTFERQYRCYPTSYLEKKDGQENGDKIILPGSAMEQLAQMEVTYPLQFKLTNKYSQPEVSTHCGVLEFTAAEGKAYLPYWVIQNLQLSPQNPDDPNGSFGIITVKNVTLPLASFVKFKPKSLDFLEISDAKAVLENTLRNFSCVTKDQEICLIYNKRNYYLEVRDLKPDTSLKACSIVEADVKVEFEAPDGFKDPSTQPVETPPVPEENLTEEEKKELKKKKLADLEARLKAEREKEKGEDKLKAFSGKGNRVDGKIKNKHKPKDKAETKSQLKTELTAAEVRRNRLKQFSKAYKPSVFQGKGNKLG